MQNNSPAQAEEAEPIRTLFTGTAVLAGVLRASVLLVQLALFAVFVVGAQTVIVKPLPTTLRVVFARIRQTRILTLGASGTGVAVCASARKLVLKHRRSKNQRRSIHRFGGTLGNQ